MVSSNRICIKNNKVINVIYADDSFVTLLNQTGNFDSILNSSDYSNKTYDIGYTFDGSNFTPPVLAQLDAQTQVQIKITKAIFQSQQMMIQLATWNVLNGITQMGKTKLIADALENVMRYCQSGSLYQAYGEMDTIVITPDMAPFLSEAKRAEIKASIMNIIVNL